MTVAPVSEDAVFAPVRSQTAFEETVERLGTAIKLGLLAPGTRLPAERELCRKLGIARSTLRQALLALGQTGHLQATRGRRGGTFVADPQPPTERPSEELIGQVQEVCDSRMALEVGVAVLAAQRADASNCDTLAALAEAMDGQLEDYPSYRQSDVRFHVALAEATGSARLIAAETSAQGEMTALISMIGHPPGGAPRVKRPAPAPGSRVALARRVARRARDERARRGHRAHSCGAPAPAGLTSACHALQYAG